MKEFDSLLDVAETLLGPNGCFWDRKQTCESLQPYLLEEAYEVTEAIDTKNFKDLKEELGDLLYVIIFIAKVAEKEKKFSLTEVVEGVKEKLIRRHPHVFQKENIDSDEELEKRWEEIKKSEKKERKSILDGIPLQLPLLLKAQKIQKKIKGKVTLEREKTNSLEEEIWDIVTKAEEMEVEVESLFRKFLQNIEEKVRKKEAGDDLLA